MPNQPSTAPAVKYGPILLLLLFLLIVANLTGCNPDDPETADADPPPVTELFPAYTAGAIYSSTNGLQSRACYWKHDSLVLLSSPNNNASYTAGIYKSGNDIYISGGYWDASKIDQPGYWKNGVFNLIDNPYPTRSATVDKMHVDGNDVYVSGGVIDETGKLLPCYWKNGRVTILKNAASPAVAVLGNAFDITVNNGDVYVGGSITTTSSERFEPCYWKNGQCIELTYPGQPSPAQTFSFCKVIGLKVVNNNIYLTGVRQNGGIYWVNGVGTRVSSEPLYDMAVADGDVYGATNLSNNLGQPVAAYTRNATTNYIPVAANVLASRGWGIGIRQRKVYLAGTYNEREEPATLKPALWIDGVLVKLRLPRGSSGDVSDIYVPE